MQHLLLVLLLAGLSVATAGAQEIRGTLVDAASGAPVPGTVVLLLDSAGARLTGAVSGERGGFVLRAPGPGAYRVRAERVGYQSTTSPPLRLAPGEVLEHRLGIAVAPVSLAGVTVVGRQRCTTRPGRGMAAAQVWDEARKALSATALAERESWFQFQVTRFTRELDPVDLRVRDETRREHTGVFQRPFASVPVESLVREGFARPDGDGMIYFAPDAEVLLSDAFLDTHCFRLVDDPARPELIGLSFEPVRGRDVPEVRGTLWLARDGAALRTMEYAYVGSGLPPEALGGLLEFHRLPSGAWIVRRWRIRMPRVAMHRFQVQGRVRNERVVAAIREEGGEVRLLESPPGAAAGASGTATGTGTVAGMVYDSIRATPLAGAVVKLEGTGRTTRTDSAGAFRLAGLGEGVYRVRVDSPRLDSLLTPAPSRQVRVDGGRLTLVRLAVPSLRTLLADACPTAAPGTSALVGRVPPPPAAPPGGPTVQVRWSRWSVSPGADQTLVDQRTGTLTARGEPDGRFRVCGIPAGVQVTARAQWGAAASDPLPLTMGRAGIQPVVLPVRERRR